MMVCRCENGEQFRGCRLQCRRAVREWAGSLCLLGTDCIACGSTDGDLAGAMDRGYFLNRDVQTAVL